MDVTERQPVVSRSQGRMVREEPWEDMLEMDALARAICTADDKLWTTAPLNLWATPGDEADKRGLLEESKKKMLGTGREPAGRVEVVVDGEAAGSPAATSPTRTPTRSRNPAVSPRRIY